MSGLGVLDLQRMTFASRWVVDIRRVTIWGNMGVAILDPRPHKPYKP